MQRTGGTTFASFLSHVAKQDFMHEPFNANQQLGGLQLEFNKKPGSLTYEQLDEAFAGRSVKHCYEYSTVLFNRFLFDYFCSRGFVQKLSPYRAENSNDVIFNQRLCNT